MTCSQGPPVHKQLWFCWEVVVDDIVNERDVNTTRSNVSGDQHTNLKQQT